MMRLLGLLLLSAFISPLLSELGFRGKRLFTVCSLVIILSALLGSVGDIFAEAGTVFDIAGISEAASSALKVVGVGYLFGISSDIVSELGESSLSKAILTAGKIEIVLLVFPYLKEIGELGLGLIK